MFATGDAYILPFGISQLCGSVPFVDVWRLAGVAGQGPHYLGTATARPDPVARVAYLFTVL